MTQEERDIVSDDGGGRVAVVDPEFVEYPDRGLDLREEFVEELRASLEAVARGEAITQPAEEVAERLGAVLVSCVVHFVRHRSEVYRLR